MTVQEVSRIRGADLSVEYAGVRFPNPFVLGSGPDADSPEKVIRAFDRGWGGAILKTTSVVPHKHTHVTPRFGRVSLGKKTIGFTNMEVSSTHSLDWWAETVHKIKREFPDRPIFASIIRTDDRTERDWVMATKMFQEAGVDGFELNFSCSHAFHAAGGGASIGKSAEATKTIAGWVKSVAKVPVVAKLPVATSYIGQVAKAAIDAGADGITAINSVPGVAGFDLDTMTPYPTVDGLSSFTGYSGQAVKPIALRAVGEVRREIGTSAPVMGCGGMWVWQDCVEFLLMGATITQLCTAPMFQGFDMAKGLIEGVGNYLADKNIASVREIIGIGYEKYRDHPELSREYKVVAAIDETRCVKCGSCYPACRDGAADAITPNPGGVPFVRGEDCIGCSLCQHVCPAQCIHMERR